MRKKIPIKPVGLVCICQKLNSENDNVSSSAQLFACFKQENGNASMYRNSYFHFLKHKQIYGQLQSGQGHAVTRVNIPFRFSTAIEQVEISRDALWSRLYRHFYSFSTNLRQLELIFVS